MEHLEMLAAKIIREKEKLDLIADAIEWIERIDTALQLSQAILS